MVQVSPDPQQVMELKALQCSNVLIATLLNCQTKHVSALTKGRHIPLRVDKLSKTKDSRQTRLNQLLRLYGQWKVEAHTLSEIQVAAIRKEIQERDILDTLTTYLQTLHILSERIGTPLVRHLYKLYADLYQDRIDYMCPHDLLSYLFSLQRDTEKAHQNPRDYYSAPANSIWGVILHHYCTTASTAPQNVWTQIHTWYTSIVAVILNIATDKKYHTPSVVLAKLCQHLTPQQANVLRLRYGLNGETPKTLIETSVLVDMSKYHVRSIEAKAMRILRHPRHTILDWFGFPKASELPEPVDTSPFHETGLSIRTVNILIHRAGITHPNDIRTLTDDQIRNLRNVGKKSADEIIAFRQQLESEQS